MTKKKILPVLFLVFFPLYTYAYLEPGTLSYVLQVLLAFFVGALVTMRIFWTNIKKFMNNLFKKGKKKEEEKT